MARPAGDRDNLSSSSTADDANGPNGGPAQSASRHPDPIDAIALLGLGLLLEGSDFVTRQVRQSGLFRDATQADLAGTHDREVTRLALIGLAAETRARAQRRREAARRARRDFLRGLSRAGAPFTRWLPMEVALTAAEILTDYGQRTIDGTVSRLAEQGRVEEEQARALAQRAVGGGIDEVLAYVAHNPAVRELVTEQGGELATSALDELRARSESVDTWLAQATRKLVKRSPRTRAPEAGGVAVTPRVSASQSGA